VEGHFINQTKLMKTHLFLFVIILLMLTCSLSAQSLSPFVLSPAGSFNSGGGYSLSQTTGEMTMVETFSNGSAILTQGIQQPAVVAVSVPELQNSPISLELFPNPGQGYFQLDIKVHNASTMRTRVIDVFGRLVLSVPERRIDESFRQVLDLSGKSDGTYMVQVILFDDTESEIFHQTKQIQLIK